MSTPQQFHVSVIGAGLAGLTAAAHAAAAGAEVACFEGAGLAGGLVANIGRLDDWPSAAPVSGAELAQQMGDRARDAGVTMLAASVTALAASPEGCALDAGGKRWTSRVVIVASGARLAQLGVPGERELAGRGVSQCDWCDGGLYRGKAVAVIGGGNAALQAALHLATLCETVTVIARGAGLRARRDYVMRAADDPKIEFLWETRVEAFSGSGGLDGLDLVNVADGTREHRAFAGAFVFPGVVPNLDFAPATLARDARGFALTDAGFRSALPGVFVVGAARSGGGGALLAAMGEATTAANAAVDDLKRADLL